MIKYDNVQLNVPDHMRPRAMREIGMPIKWDIIIDELPKPNIRTASGVVAQLCILYRNVRPKQIGNRCAFSPSCSRYAEFCFRNLGFWTAVKLTISRLRRCNSKNGGDDLPPGLSKQHLNTQDKSL